MPTTVWAEAQDYDLQFSSHLKLVWRGYRKRQFPLSESRPEQSFSKLAFAIYKVERYGILRGGPVEFAALVGLGRYLEQEILKVFHLTHSEPGLSQNNLASNPVALKILDESGSYFQADLYILKGKQSRSWHIGWRNNLRGLGHLIVHGQLELQGRADPVPYWQKTQGPTYIVLCLGAGSPKCIL